MLTQLQLIELKRESLQRFVQNAKHHSLVATGNGSPNHKVPVITNLDNSELLAIVSNRIKAKKHQPKGSIAASLASGSTRIDPTRTGNIRKRFQSDCLTRLKQFKQALYELIVKDNAFLLTQNAERFIFTSTADQAEAFRKWLSKQLKDKILGDPKTPSEAWWNEYIKQGYKQGQKRAWQDAKRAGFKPTEDGTTSDYDIGKQEQFLKSAFNNPVSIERVKELSGRVFTELQGVTDTMAQQISRALLDGLTQGQSPKEIFRNMSLVSDKIGNNRTMMIANTEIVRTHNEGQLDALEEMGMDEVGVMVEWLTAGRPCEMCNPLNGVVISIKKARGLLPRHPNCKCCWIPAMVGEDDDTRKDTKPQIKKAINQSLVAERGGNSSLAKAKAKSRWAGADYAFNAAKKSGSNCGTGSGGFKAGNKCGGKSKSVSPEVLDVITRWAKGPYLGSQNYQRLRAGKDPVLEKLLVESPKYKGTVWRGIVLTKAKLKDLLSSKGVAFNKHSSASKKEAVARSVVAMAQEEFVPKYHKSRDVVKSEKVLFKIHTKSGVAIDHLIKQTSTASHLASQAEVILSKKSAKYLIHKVEKPKIIQHVVGKNKWTTKSPTVITLIEDKSLTANAFKDHKGRPGKVGGSLPRFTPYIGSSSYTTIRVGDKPVTVYKNPSKSIAASWLGGGFEIVGVKVKNDTYVWRNTHESSLGGVTRQLLPKSTKFSRTYFTLEKSKSFNKFGSPVAREFGLSVQIPWNKFVKSGKIPGEVRPPTEKEMRAYIGRRQEAAKAKTTLRKPTKLNIEVNGHPVKVVKNPTSDQLAKWHQKVYTAGSNIVGVRSKKGNIYLWEEHVGVSFVSTAQKLLKQKDHEAVRVTTQGGKLSARFWPSDGSGGRIIPWSKFANSSPGSIKKQPSKDDKLAAARIRDEEATKRAVQARLAKPFIPGLPYKSEADFKKSQLKLKNAKYVEPLSKIEKHIKVGSRFDTSRTVKEELAQVKREFGLTKKDIVGLTGAQPGATLSMSISSGQLYVMIKHPDYRCNRTITKGSDGKMSLHNDELFINDNAQGKGLGTKILAQQVTHATKLGLTHMETYAARSHSMNGYYTWARLGYDAQLPSHTASRVKADLGGKRPETMSDLMKLPGGPKWWLKNGNGWDGGFDLTKGSLSRRLMAAYLTEKHKEKVEQILYNEEFPDDLDEVILDRIWARLAKTSYKNDPVILKNLLYKDGKLSDDSNDDVQNAFYKHRGRKGFVGGSLPRKGTKTSATIGAFLTRTKLPGNKRLAGMNLTVPIGKLVRSGGAGGSTGAMILQDPNSGQKFIRKKGANSGHLLNEHYADKAYGAAGLGVPQHYMYNNKAGAPVKLAKFVDGVTMDKLSKTDFMKAAKELRKGFAIDAALANWDIGGGPSSPFDNAMYNKKTKQIYRIDNGGALAYRGMGEKKGDAWNTNAVEWFSMRDPKRNPRTGMIYGGMSKKELSDSIKLLNDNREKILKALPESERQKVSQRIDAINAYHIKEVTGLLSVKKASGTLYSTHYTGKEMANYKFPGASPKPKKVANPKAKAKATPKTALKTKGKPYWNPETHKYQAHKFLPLSNPVKKPTKKSVTSIISHSDMMSGLNQLKKKLTVSLSKTNLAKIIKLNPNGIENKTLKVPKNSFAGGSAKYAKNQLGYKFPGVKVKHVSTLGLSKSPKVDKNQGAYSGKMEPPKSKTKKISLGKLLAADKHEANHKALMSTLKKGCTASPTQYKPLLKEIGLLNPKGIEKKTLYVPEGSFTSPSSLTKLKALLPPGTKVVPKALPDTPQIDKSANMKEYLYNTSTGKFKLVTTNLSKKQEAESQKLPEKLSSSESHAMASWGDDSYPTRKAFRSSPKSPQVKEFRAILDKAPVYKGLIYRGIDSKGKTDYVKQLLSLGVGKVWKEGVPGSSSRSPGTAQSFASGNLMLVIKTKTSRVVETVTDHSHEREHILHPDAKYRIVSLHPNHSLTTSGGYHREHKLVAVLEEL